MEHDIELEDIGWKVLQQRQVHVEKLVRQAIRTALELHDAVHLLDLALGSGRQIMTILRSLPEQTIHAKLCDIDRTNLEKGEQLANQLGLTRVDFASIDAFDARALAAIDTRTNVVLATGIFELTQDQAKVQCTLGGLADHMHAGGLLVYTDQPAHPDLDMIGRVAVQRDESPWTMRRRAVETMNNLLLGAGFELRERLSDQHGLFTVGLVQLP